MRKLAAVFVLGAMMLSAVVVYADETHEFTVANIEYEGTKIWVPSTLVVHKGDKVKIKLHIEATRPA